MNSTLITEAVIYDSNGNMKKPYKDKISWISIHHHYKKKEIEVKPWWDEKCQKVIDYRKQCYKDFVRFFLEKV